MSSRLRVRGLGASALLLAIACGSGAPARDRAATANAPAEDRDTVNTEAATVELKAEEARAKGLKPIGMRADPKGAPLSLLKFPEPDKYLIASGPPGAPLLAIVWAADEREGDAAAVEAAVRRMFAQPWQQPLVIGEVGSVEIGGAARPAMAFMTGQQMRKTAWCGVLMSGPNASVLVTLGRAPGDAAAMSCAEVMAEPSLAVFARTFVLVP